MSVFLLAVRTDHRTLKTIQKTSILCISMWLLYKTVTCMLYLWGKQHIVSSVIRLISIELLSIITV